MSSFTQNKERRGGWKGHEGRGGFLSRPGKEKEKT